MGVLANRFMTPDGTILWSKHRHDYVSHTDANGKTYAIDGGSTYSRIIGDAQDLVNKSISWDDTHEVKRLFFLWGTYGKYGKGPKVYKPLCQLDTNHIEAILQTQMHISEQVKKLMKDELQLRSDKLIKQEK